MAVQRLRLEIDDAEAYEFVLSLAAATSGSGIAAPRSLVDEVSAFAGGCDMVWAHLLTIAYDTPAPRDIGGLLKEIQAMHPGELRLRLLGYYVRFFRRATSPEVIAAAAAGDARAIKRFTASSYPDDVAWQAALKALLPLTAWETRRRLLRLLIRWEQFFRLGIERASVRAETAALRAKARRRRPEQVIAAVMQGWDYVPEPGINAVLLIPSRSIWPHSHVFDHHSTKVICYPVPPHSKAAAAVPASLLAAGQAIGDERRLRVLRLLAEEELPAAEIASRLDIGLTTLMHHLGLLHAAGLVTASAEYRKRYRLHRAALAELGRELESFLLA